MRVERRDEPAGRGLITKAEAVSAVMYEKWHLLSQQVITVNPNKCK